MSELQFYTIKELTKEVNRTAATIYNYMRSDEETKRFFVEHRRENTKGGYVYDEKVLERLKNKYLIEGGAGTQKNFSADSENPISTAPHGEEITRLSAEIERLTAELEETSGKCAALQSDLEKADAERAELLRQNGNLLLLLSQEKAEKQALLPPPRRSIGERIKNLFKKNEE